MQTFKVKFYASNYVDFTTTETLIVEMEVKAVDYDAAFSYGESIAKNMIYENKRITIGIEEIE